MTRAAPEERSSGQAATVGLANSSLGNVLVDSQRRTLAAAADVQGALRYEQVIGHVRPLIRTAPRWIQLSACNVSGGVARVGHAR